MMIYSLIVNNQQVSVTLDTKNPNERSPLEFQGNPDGIEEIRRWIEFQSGANGHMIGEVTTPIDLHYVMNSPEAIAAYSPTLAVGQEMITSYSRGIPPNAMT